MSTLHKKSVGQRIWAIIAALLYVLAGFFFIKYPIESLDVVGIIYVIFFIAAGFSQIFGYFVGRKLGASGWLLALGIIDVILGCYLLANANALFMLVPLFIIIWAFIVGFGRIGLAFSQRKQSQGWIVTLLLGLLLLFIGVLMIFLPLFSVVTVSILFAIAMFVLGIQQVVEAFD